MSFRLFVVSLIISGPFLGWIMHAQRNVVAQKEVVANEELLYFPNEKLLSHFTGGMGNVVADLMWLRTIKYMAQEFEESRRKFEWLEHMSHTVTDLDPYFADAYENGGMFLSAVGEDDKALALLKKGLIANPDSADIPMEIVRTYILNRRDDPVTPKVVPHYLRLVAERHKHPEMYLNWARQIQEDHNIAEQSKEMWLDTMRNAKDKMIYDLAAKNYYTLVAQEHVSTLEQAAAYYKSRVGGNIEDLSDLVDARILDALPKDPNEGMYFVDAQGKIQNSLLLADLTQRMIIGINSSIGQFRSELGRNPKSLDELQAHYDIELPAHPIAGQEWNYDPQVGRVLN